MDDKRIDAAIAYFELGEMLPGLQASRVSSRREGLMAATAKIWGLNLWIDGGTFILLDERGFLCSSLVLGQVIRLCTVESILGPGAVRAILSRPIIDPNSEIFVVESRKRVPLPPNAVAPKNKPRLDPAVFAALLKEL